MYLTTVREEGKRSFKAYKKWMREISDIARQASPDVIHFLYGDGLYRYFGVGLGALKKYKIVITFHWARSGYLHRLSTKRICKHSSRAVVHSEYIASLFRKDGIDNVESIEYPVFKKAETDKREACAYFDLDPAVPTIGCIGGTRYDKGLDLLLEALGDVAHPFQLLVAGKEDTFDRAYIESHSGRFAKNVRLCLKYLTDDDFAHAIAACDIIALPYRKVFNGASGPMTEGVAAGKCIVGPNHGNLGFTIGTHDLGYLFETEDVASLRAALEQALSEPFRPSAAYSEFCDGLNVERFKADYLAIYRQLVGEEP